MRTKLALLLVRGEERRGEGQSVSSPEMIQFVFSGQSASTEEVGARLPTRLENTERNPSSVVLGW